MAPQSRPRRVFEKIVSGTARLASAAGGRAADRHSIVADETSVRAFVKWCNFHLSADGDKVTDLSVDFRDGKRLLKLLEVVSGEKLPRPERASMRIHYIQNVAKSLKYLETKLGEPLANCSAEDIVDGNVKLTLAMLYQVTRFQLLIAADDPSLAETVDHARLAKKSSKETALIRNAADGAVAGDAAPARDKASASEKPPLGDAKASILAWCNSQIAKYVERGLAAPVTDFSASWRSGLAFSALLHRHDRYLLPRFPEMVEGLRSGTATPASALHQAFKVAETHLNIPQLLEPEDLVDVEKPDEKIVLACLTGWYSALSKIQRTPEWQAVDNERWQEYDPMLISEEGLRKWEAERKARSQANKNRTAEPACPHPRAEPTDDDPRVRETTTSSERPAGGWAAEPDGTAAEAGETAASPEPSDEIDGDLDLENSAESPDEGTRELAQAGDAAPAEEAIDEAGTREIGEWVETSEGLRTELAAILGTAASLLEADRRDAGELSYLHAELSGLQKDVSSAAQEGRDLLARSAGTASPQHPAFDVAAAEKTRACVRELDADHAAAEELVGKLARAIQLHPAGDTPAPKSSPEPQPSASPAAPAAAVLPAVRDALETAVPADPPSHPAGDTPAPESSPKPQPSAAPAEPAAPVPRAVRDDFETAAAPADLASRATPAAARREEKSTATENPVFTPSKRQVTSKSGSGIDSWIAPAEALIEDCEVMLKEQRAAALDLVWRPTAIDKRPPEVKDARCEAGVAEAADFHGRCESLARKVVVSLNEGRKLLAQLEGSAADDDLVRATLVESVVQRLESSIFLALKGSREYSRLPTQTRAARHFEDKARKFFHAVRNLESAIAAVPVFRLGEPEKGEEKVEGAEAEVEAEGGEERQPGRRPQLPGSSSNNGAGADPAACFSFSVYEALRRVELELDQLESHFVDLKAHRFSITPLSKSVVLLSSEAVAQFELELDDTLAVPRDRLSAASAATAAAAEDARRGVTAHYELRPADEVASEVSQLADELQERLKALHDSRDFAPGSAAAAAMPAGQRKVALGDCHCQIETMVNPAVPVVRRFAAGGAHAGLEAKLQRLEAYRLATAAKEAARESLPLAQAPQSPRVSSSTGAGAMSPVPLELVLPPRPTSPAPHKRVDSKTALSTPRALPLPPSPTHYADDSGSAKDRRSVMNWIERQVNRRSKRQIQH